MIAPAAELYLQENIDKVRLENENRRLSNALKERFKPSNIIGNSKPMQEVYELIRKVAGIKATVLILGESGVGKELVANAIHYNGALRRRPVHQIQLRRAAGKHRRKRVVRPREGARSPAPSPCARAASRLADGGTIFLDEVGELSLPMQAKLLRVLQEKTFERVGGIAARQGRSAHHRRHQPQPHRDGGEGNVPGGFVLPAQCFSHDHSAAARPRQRRHPARRSLRRPQFAAETGKEVKRISTPALNMLMAYHWPGNVRELENVIERSVILSEDGVIHGYNLPPSLADLDGDGHRFRLRPRGED